MRVSWTLPTGPPVSSSRPPLRSPSDCHPSEAHLAISLERSTPVERGKNLCASTNSLTYSKERCSAAGNAVERQLKVPPQIFEAFHHQQAAIDRKSTRLNSS